jgi:2-oxoglutarate ferredoxin oxidoreductase subunit gamma
MIMIKSVEQRYDIRLSGTGGQGLILVGIILAEAANLEGKYVVQTQSYGPEARGGASRAEVIISNSPIGFLMVEEADIFLALSPEAYTKYCYRVKPRGIIVVDEQVNPKLYLTKVNVFPIIRTAREDLGSEIAANIVALGVITVISGILNISSVEKALMARVPPHTIDLNLKALHKGCALGMERVKSEEVEKL